MQDGYRMDAGWIGDGCRMDMGWMWDGYGMVAGWMWDGCGMQAVGWGLQIGVLTVPKGSLILHQSHMSGTEMNSPRS